MKCTVLILAITFTFFSCHKKVMYEVENGVSWKLSKQREGQIDAIHYKLFFDIPKEKDQSIDARLELKVDLVTDKAPLVLDFNPNNTTRPEIFIEEDTIAYTYKNEHLIIPQTYLKTGENTFKIKFQAGDLSLNRHDEYVYTLLVPDRARTLFPCFDQPSLKATYSLKLKTPKTWKVLSTSYPESVLEEGDFKLHAFGTSNVMSTYLFSFAAGIFEEENRHNHRFLYREKDTIKISESLDPIFDFHEKSLQFLEDYTQYRFPFKKLDFIGIPFFQFGGMEHVGAIQYKASSLFFENYMPKIKHWNRANLIAHETAHMWFGNLVTMNWFDDVWLKEVFANFIAAKIANPNFSDINYDLLNLITKAPSAYHIDRTQGANAIRQKLENLNDAGSLYGEIIYNKAPIMMRQLELILGEQKFKEGLQEYIKTYANGNASWDDLVAIFDAKTEIDIQAWSDVWVNQTGRPIFENDIVYDHGKIKEIGINQVAEDKSDKIWIQKFEVALIYKDSIIKHHVNITGASQNLQALVGLPKPEAIVYNSNGYGYGVFPLDTTAAINTFKLKDDVVRAQNYINIYENTLSGTIPVKTALQAYLYGLTYETNDLILGTISGNFLSLYWHFLSWEERNNIQEKITLQLWTRLQESLPIPIKKTIFKVFRSLAYQGKSLGQLYEVWSKEVRIENLRLNEKDYTELAMKLALYKHSKQDIILKQARAMITNQDEKDKFEFLLPALSRNPEERRDLFLSFQDVENRSNTVWIQTANSILHHPLHQKESVKYVSLSLDMLEEIKETSDLFFPKTWLATTIGMYQSKEAQHILENYLKDNPDLNLQLKAKLLQATDNLMRYRQMIKE